MSEHSISIGIDASPAKRGATEFRSAIAAIKVAVKDLERDASGAFTVLRNLKPQFDVTPLRSARDMAQGLGSAMGGAATAATKAGSATDRAALAASMALRQATTSAQKLAFRLDDLGDVQGLDRLDAAVDKLHASLRRAPDVAAVRLARNEYENLRTELTQGVTASEYARGAAAHLAREQGEAARAAAQHEAALSALRAEFNPLYSASKQYEATLDRIALAEREGVISAQLAANAREKARDTLAGFDRVGKAASQVGYQVQNASYQIGDFFVQVAAGTDATRALAMQLPQLLGGFGVWGAAAGAVAAIMGALIPLLISGGEKARTFDDVMGDLNSTLTTYRDSAAAVNGGTLALREEFGLAAESAQRFYDAMAAVSAMKLEQQMQDGVAALGVTMSGVTDLMDQWDKATFLPEALRPETILLTADAADQLQAKFGLSVNQAHALTAALSEAKMAKGPKETSAAMGKVVSLLLAARDAGAQLPPELVKAVEEAAQLGLTADRLQAILAPMPGMIGEATGQTWGWASAMSAVGAEVSAILSSLAALGGSVITNAGKRAELVALEAGQTVRQAEVARLTYEHGVKQTAKEMAADAKGGIAGWIEKQIIKAEDFQFAEGLRLDDQLTAGRAAARKRESAAAGGGRKGGGSGRKGGSGREKAAELTDEAKAYEKLAESIQSETNSLMDENAALMLVATGRADNIETAKLMAEAARLTGGAVDETTMALIRQREEAEKLNKQLKILAADPLKEWLDGVPGWIEAGQKIEVEVFQSLSDTIEEFIKTGKFDLESLGESILGIFADIVADKATKELLNLFGMGGGDGKKAGFNLGGVLGNLFGSTGDEAMPDLGAAGTQEAMISGSMTAGSNIGNAMVTAGSQVAGQLQAALTSGATTAGASVRSGMASGGAVAGAQVQSGAASGGAVLGQGVVQGANQGAPILAQGVASGAAGGGGGGGGFMGLMGLILPGIFHSGGQVTSNSAGTTAYPASLWMDAPRMHSGGPVLAADEVPAVLQTGEHVLSRKQVKNLASAQGGDAADDTGRRAFQQTITMNLHGVSDPDAFRKSRSQVEGEASRAMARASKRMN